MRLVRWWTHQLQIHVFSLVTALSYSFWNVLWEVRLQNYIIMQVVLEILSTFAATMTVIDAKYLQLRPFLCWDSGCFLSWLYHIEDNWYAIFVGFPDYSNICIGSESFDSAESLRANLTRLEKWQSSLRLVLLKQLSNCSFDISWGHLSFCACSR